MENTEEREKLILDYSKWICGVPMRNKVNGNFTGKGKVRLLNGSGFMCCLGQICHQMGVPKRYLKYNTSPANIVDIAPSLKEKIWPFIHFNNNNSELSKRAVIINDNMDTTVGEKIQLLQDLFASHGFDLEVINMPQQ